VTIEGGIKEAPAHAWVVNEQQAWSWS